MTSDHQSPLKARLEITSNIVMSGRLLVFCSSVNRLPGIFDALAFNMHTKMQAHTHTPTHTNINNSLLHTGPAYKMCVPHHTLRPRLFSSGQEHSGTCYYVQYNDTKP